MTNCNFLNGEVSYSRLRWVDSLTNVGAYLNHSRLGDAASPVSVGVSNIKVLNFTWQR